MIGQLFTQDFLSTGIRETPAWQAISDAELDEFTGRLKRIYGQLNADSNLNEPITENEIIVRVLSSIGWSDILTQQVASKSRREDLAFSCSRPRPRRRLHSRRNAKIAALRGTRPPRPQSPMPEGCERRRHAAPHPVAPSPPREALN